MKRLLKLGADVDYRCDENGTTALHQTAKNAHKDVVEALLEAGASVDDADDRGAIALHFATSTDVVETLIMAGADVDHEDSEGKTPGRLALECQNMTVVEALIRGRADVGKIYNPPKDTASSRRVTSGHGSEGEEAALQQNHVRGVRDPSAQHERDTDGHMTALALELSDLEIQLTDRGGDRASSPAAGDQPMVQRTSRMHAVHAESNQVHQSDLISHVTTASTPELCSQPSAIDSVPDLDVDKDGRQRKLIIGIVSIEFPPTNASYTHYIL